MGSAEPNTKLVVAEVDKEGTQSGLDARPFLEAGVVEEAEGVVEVLVAAGYNPQHRNLPRRHLNIWVDWAVYIPIHRLYRMDHHPKTMRMAFVVRPAPFEAVFVVACTWIDLYWSIIVIPPTDVPFRARDEEVEEEEVQRDEDYHL